LLEHSGSQGRIIVFGELPRGFVPCHLSGLDL
jgi:hypothetical protein